MNCATGKGDQAADVQMGFMDTMRVKVNEINAWRREWDSNPRYLAVNTLSKRAPSATRPSLRRRFFFNLSQPCIANGASRPSQSTQGAALYTRARIALFPRIPLSLLGFGVR
jgi:hypothetical protein